MSIEGSKGACAVCAWCCAHTGVDLRVACSKLAGCCVVAEQLRLARVWRSWLCGAVAAEATAVLVQRAQLTHLLLIAA